MARIRCAEQYFQLYRAQSTDEASNDVLRSQPYLLALAAPAEKEKSPDE